MRTKVASISRSLTSRSRPQQRWCGLRVDVLSAMKVASTVGIGKITEASAAVPFIYILLFVLTFLLAGAMQGLCGNHCFVHERCSFFSQVRCKVFAASSAFFMFTLSEPTLFCRGDFPHNKFRIISRAKYVALAVSRHSGPGDESK
ncbi:hypothetical protein Tcan_04683 [Toxocara canis]|uniref:Uncharacterized protein n=1 Tax=Toxocara canis TaxID=6265 RepID=A0A0B2VN10_TOXCA|nr:hypothetical protein Tcan_04683 [Toxocara canis]